MKAWRGRINTLTVLGLGSSILCIKDFTSAENHCGQENSAALICKKSNDDKFNIFLIKDARKVNYHLLFCIMMEDQSRKRVRIQP